MRSVLKYLLLFCFLFSGWYSYSSLENNTGKHQQSTFDIIPSTNSVVKHAIPGSENKDLNLVAVEFENEEDEDKFDASKDYLSGSSYFASVFITPSIEALYSANYKCHTCDFASLYILLQVFRL